MLKYRHSPARQGFKEADGSGWIAHHDADSAFALGWILAWYKIDFIDLAVAPVGDFYRLS